MASGTPLTDADRLPWLQRICDRIDATEGNQVVTCSAFRRRYRDLLRTSAARVRFLHLSGTRAILSSRLIARTDHFMPVTLLTSQVNTLEPLAGDQDGVSVDIDGSPAEIVERASIALDLHHLTPTPRVR
jgi:gluconokinase